MTLCARGRSKGFLGLVGGPCGPEAGSCTHRCFFPLDILAGLTSVLKVSSSSSHVAGSSHMNCRPIFGTVFVDCTGGDVCVH